MSPCQFDFVPLDSRVKVQPCDRPLVMDLPFATNETVRVRCLGTLSWQLYLRANIKTPVAKPTPPQQHRWRQRWRQHRQELPAVRQLRAAKSS